MPRLSHACPPRQHWLLAALLSVTPTLPAQPLAAPAAVTADHPAALSARYGADERGMRRYVLVVLRSSDTPVTDPTRRKAMFEGHFANMQRLAEAGQLALAGPFIDSDSGWRGLFVLAVDDLDSARALVATDPVIEQGEMVADYHPWYGSAALMAVNALHTQMTAGSDSPGN